MVTGIPALQDTKADTPYKQGVTGSSPVPPIASLNYAGEG
jgi:hypothetical protein